MSKLVRGAGNVLSKRASAVGDRCACNKSIYSALAQKVRGALARGPCGRNEVAPDRVAPQPAAAEEPVKSMWP